MFGKTENLWFSWFSDMSMNPKTNTCYRWRHQGSQNKSRKPETFLKNMIVGNLKNGNPTLAWRSVSWTWDQYLSKNMEWHFEGTWTIVLYFQLKELKHSKSLSSIKGLPPTPQHTDSHPWTLPIAHVLLKVQFFELTVKLFGFVPGALRKHGHLWLQFFQRTLKWNK